ncbi:TonB-dependent receptor [Hymenobacter sp. BT664]|uniref:TonB-dependent receptor n=1 Tax=Hymenobacter montanus TaxID=2771359 RepID=A0A927BD56_9BACT|nr:TonB-dependent receptor [Hymenobacter montanus]MBD2767974.1 TonB-dependent receptor [Hymenobacter montanus]
MKQRFLLLGTAALLVAAPIASVAQTLPAASPPTGRATGARTTLSGYLKDAATGEALIGATVFVKSLGAGATANEYGFYSLTVPPGRYTFTYTYVGYAPVEETLDLTASLVHSVKLSTKGVETAEVVVTGKVPDQNVRSTEVGVARLDARAIKLVPALLGEADLVRAVQLLPGVSTVGEGATGFNVRGGGIDQNLILMDEAPVYNSSHLFGLFSVFNPDAVKDVKLVKGGIPAAYGGRLSSLLDIRMKDGNSQRLSANGGIGLVSSRLAVEAPIVKDKGSFMVAGRRSYADLFLKAVPEQKDNQAYFYDLSAKANYTLGEQDRLFLSGYFGRDVFKFGKVFQNSWGNQTGTLRWNHVFNSRLFMNVTALASRYDYGLGVPTGTQGFDWKSDITDYSAKADFEFFRNPQSVVRFGASSIFYTFQPGHVVPTEDKSIYRELRLQEQRGTEWAAYLDEERSFGPVFSVQYGLRATLFENRSTGTFYDYEGTLGQQLTPVNPQTYGSGRPLGRYPNLEPRLSARYALSESSSLKFGYNRMVQYIHLISNTTAATPLDVWLPSTRNVKPEHADQLSLGYFRNFKNNAYETSVEVFGKRMDNQIDYIAGANTLLNQNLEGELLYGRGRAYGAEFYIKKNEGRLTGWLSYTLSRSERQIDGINQNNWYANKYDKTHVLALVGVYAVSDRLSLSSTFNYSTGVATTVPDSRYVYQGLVVPNVNGDVRNNFRVPAYHRLDLAATLQQKPHPNRRWQGSWVFSIYNVYARRNAFGIYFRQNEDNPTRTEAVRLSVFGSLLPSATYNFNF